MNFKRQYTYYLQAIETVESLEYSSPLTKQPQGISTGERPFVDILQDRRFWIIHLITIPSLFLAGYIFILSGLVSRIFSGGSLNEYFFADSDQLAIINDRFSALNEIEDV